MNLKNHSVQKQTGNFNLKGWGIHLLMIFSVFASLAGSAINVKPVNAAGNLNISKVSSINPASGLQYGLQAAGKDIISQQSCNNDIYEPDNNYTQAKTISTDGIPQSHNNHPSTDEDWVTFHAIGGDQYEIGTLLTNDINQGDTAANDTLLYLYAPDGVTQLAFNDDVGDFTWNKGYYHYRESLITWIAPSTGDYYVRELQWGPTLGYTVTDCHTYDMWVIDMITTPILALLKTSTTVSVTFAGQVIPYTYQLTNNTNATLTGIVLNDNKTVPSCPQTTLVTGGSMVCTASYTVTQADMNTGGFLTNTANARYDPDIVITTHYDIPITPIYTETPTYAPTPSDTPTDTPTYTFTPSNTATLTYTPTPSDTPTNTPTYTFTPSNTATLTYSPTNTPTLFDPPFGIKTVNASGLPELTWTMVWINGSNIVAVNAAVSDSIQEGTTYVAASLSCTGASPLTVTTLCAYEIPSVLYPRGRVVWTGTIGPDFGATDAGTANNELIITFRVKVSSAVDSVQNMASMDADLNGDGDLIDPGEQQVASANASWTRPSNPPTPTPPLYGSIIPETGFAPDRKTLLPSQTTVYAELGGLWLEIPRLGVQMPIVGVPVANGKWDVSWLGSAAGWLNGSAYPTWNGNSVLTGHVYDAAGNPGPFARLNTLWWGDKVIVHISGAQYIYEVRSVQQSNPGNSAAMMKHETLPWLTLVTCRGYDISSDSYLYRVLVRAVLIEVR
jgi:LPXTG-site transpeptidase (sortase) family protein